MTKERPVLMHARSINGILAGRKTQTRRIVKPSVKGCTVGSYTNGDPSKNEVVNVQPDGDPWTDIKCPYGERSDRLWIRETFYIDDLRWIGQRLPKHMPNTLNPDDIYFRAAGECCDQIAECQCATNGKPKWRPGIFMPRWASRLTLEITGIRVERVQGISELDAMAEGILEGNSVPVETFAMLWDDTNGKGAWERNDWCWVVDFKRCAL